jgi:hypothetical protein
MIALRDRRPEDCLSSRRRTPVTAMIMKREPPASPTERATVGAHSLEPWRPGAMSTPDVERIELLHRGRSLPGESERAAPGMQGVCLVTRHILWWQTSWCEC